MRLFNKERYFVVSYITTDRNHQFSIGKMDIIARHYLNEEATIKDVKKKVECDKVVITNVVELNKKDFEYWQYRNKESNSNVEEIVDFLHKIGGIK